MPPCKLIVGDMKQEQPQRNYLSDNSTRAFQCPLDLVFQDLVVETASGKRLLHGVSGKARCGRLLAIMGESGCGKTTLLNELSFRSRGLTRVSGNAFCKLQRDCDGVGKEDMYEYTRSHYKRIGAYVMQSDVLFEQMTVQDTLAFAAQCKMPRGCGQERRKLRIQQVLEETNLSECADVLVGSPWVTGISGGQRKRLSVAVEILVRPKILFLDECTSGLDNYSAVQLVKMLQEVVAHQDGVAVVATIHQPSGKIFKMFDDVLVMHKGHSIYCGPIENIERFYESAGVSRDPEAKLCEWVLDALHTQEAFRQIKSAAQDELSDLVWEKSGVTILGLEKETESRNESFMSFQNHEKISWLEQFWICFKRAVRLYFGNPLQPASQAFLSIIIAIFAGFTYFNIPYTSAKAPVWNAALFFCTISQGFVGSLITINQFPSERTIIMRERSAGMYQCSAYFLGRFLAEIFCQIWWPLLFSLVVYWPIGFQRTAGQFFLFALFLILSYFSANSIALLISSCTRSFLLAATFLALALETARIFSGFFLPPISLPAYFAWLDAVSYLKYPYMGMVLNQFSNLVLACPALTNGTTTPCPFPTGNAYLESLGIGMIPIVGCVFCSLALIFVLRLCSYLVIRFYDA